MTAGPDLSKESIAKYFATRLPTLFTIPGRSFKTLNPVPAARAMSRTHWNFFFMGWLSWVVDAMDFFCVSVSAPEIAKSLNVSITDITWGLTLVLMLRSVGALIFGFAGDYYGRKWPLIICLLLFVALEIWTGFVTNYNMFLGVRALFGICMGGLYPLASACALDDAPVVSKGFLSGIFLPGYSLGYVLAIAFFRAFQATPQTWRALFWFSAGPPLLLAAWRAAFPENQHFLQQQEAKRSHNQMVEEETALNGGVTPSHLQKVDAWSDLKKACKSHWLMFIYLVLLMSGFNFMSHGSQDLFPTMLTQQAGFDPNQRVSTLVCVNMGAVVGGFFVGQYSELVGRRLAIITCCLGGGAFLYPAFFSREMPKLMGTGFFLQFFIMGCWGIAPLHLFELTPPNYRALASGLAYQLGNLVSSASSTIESTLGEKYPITRADGTPTHDYGKVMAIFTGAVFAYMIVVTILGPENYHKDMSTDEMKAARDEKDDASEKVSLFKIESKPTEEHREYA